MLPEARSQDLLYVSQDVSSLDDVAVFDYPNGKPVGMLTGFEAPANLCADRNGNVWIPNSGGTTIVEYAHGGSQPIATLQVPGGASPLACSVDPTSGDLAAIVSGGSNSSPHVYFIYKHASGSPETHHVDFPAYGCSYDSSGNLFVDGNREPNKRSQIGFKLGELPRGKTRFRTFSVGRGYDFWGQVQWDGKYVDVSAYEYILRFAIHGRKAVPAGGVILHGLKYINGFWIQGSKVIATNRFGMSQYPLV
ncbi:MAG TPA: hypothetical protein VGG51_12360 [Candidatus Cybelea sp.]|jgi:hypothetical protein